MSGAFAGVRGAGELDDGGPQENQQEDQQGAAAGASTDVFVIDQTPTAMLSNGLMVAMAGKLALMGPAWNASWLSNQDAVWDRMQIANKLRAVLREYYPTFLAAFTDLASKEARATLRIAPSPVQGQRIRARSLTTALRRAGRTRGIPAAVARIHAELHEDQLRQATQIEAATPSMPPRCCTPSTPQSTMSPASSNL